MVMNELRIEYKYLFCYFRPSFEIGKKMVFYEIVSTVFCSFSLELVEKRKEFATSQKLEELTELSEVCHLSGFGDCESINSDKEELEETLKVDFPEDTLILTFLTMIETVTVVFGCAFVASSIILYVISAKEDKSVKNSEDKLGA